MHRLKLLSSRLSLEVVRVKVCQYRIEDKLVKLHKHNPKRITFIGSDISAFFGWSLMICASVTLHRQGSCGRRGINRTVQRLIQWIAIFIHIHHCFDAIRIHEVVWWSFRNSLEPSWVFFAHSNITASSFNKNSNIAFIIQNFATNKNAQDQRMAPNVIDQQTRQYHLNSCIAKLTYWFILCIYTKHSHPEQCVCYYLTEPMLCYSNFEKSFA